MSVPLPGLTSNSVLQLVGHLRQRLVLELDDRVAAGSA